MGKINLIWSKDFLITFGRKKKPPWLAKSTAQKRTKRKHDWLLMRETWNRALIDTGCSATVCGWDWAECLVESLSEQSQAKVEKYESEKTFKFGGGERRKSCGFWRIPCFMAGRNVMLETDIVNADIPCLLSKPEPIRAWKVHLRRSPVATVENLWCRERCPGTWAKL